MLNRGGCNNEIRIFLRPAQRTGHDPQIRGAIENVVGDWQDFGVLAKQVELLQLF